jgi:AraC-like DNA-binding protein
MLSVSSNGNIISNPAKRFYEPHTKEGVFLGGESTTAPVVHECGVMRLDAKWDYRGVCSPFWRAYLNFSTGAAVESNGIRFPLRPETLIILPSETVYHCLPKEGVRHLWIHFTPRTATTTPGPLSLSLSATEAQCWFDLAQMIEQSPDDPRLLAAHSTGLLLPQLARSQPNALVQMSSKMESLIGWLEMRLSEPPTPEEMALWTGMSVRTFARWFGEETNDTPAAWFARRRIREACRRLRFSTDSIETIAEATGFANRHHFSRVFASETGTTPAAYRKHRPEAGGSH